MGNRPTRSAGQKPAKADTGATSSPATPPAPGTTTATAAAAAAAGPAAGAAAEERRLVVEQQREQQQEGEEGAPDGAAGHLRRLSSCSIASSDSDGTDVLPLAGRSPRSSLASFALAFKKDDEHAATSSAAGKHAHQHQHHRAATSSPAALPPLALVTEEEAVEAGDGGAAAADGVGRRHHHHHHLDYHHHVRLADMCKRENIGLYTHYAAVGLMGGMSGIARPFCDYVFTDAPANLCANANSIIFLAWNFKVLFALVTDTWKPFGLRRKPYILTGWLCILALLLVIAASADQLTAQSWIVLSMLVQFFVMLADVPADGYSVELGHLEHHDERGQILATGQFIRFMACVFAGAIQSFLLNGPSTNDQTGCPIAWDSCWSWGLTMAQYYYLLFALTAVLFVPLLWMREIEDRSPSRSIKQFAFDIFDTCRNLTTTYLLVFVVGSTMLALSPFNVTTNMQYLVIKIPNLLAGIDSMTTYLSLSCGIYIFQKCLINKNWRTVNYGSGIFTSILGLLWLLPFYNVGGLRNGWFTIFISLDQSFAAGLSQVLFSMTVIELAKPGQEATVYELLISVANSCMTVSSILSTQLLAPLGAATCQSQPCPPDSIDMAHYDASGGPRRSTIYLLVTTAISLGATACFTCFLPTQKPMCQAWKAKGERASDKHRDLRAALTLVFAVLIVAYGILGSVLLLDKRTSCLKFIGGPGCEA